MNLFVIFLIFLSVFLSTYLYLNILCTTDLNIVSCQQISLVRFHRDGVATRQPATTMSDERRQWATMGGDGRVLSSRRAASRLMTYRIYIQSPSQEAGVEVGQGSGPRAMCLHICRISTARRAAPAQPRAAAAASCRSRGQASLVFSFFYVDLSRFVGYIASDL